MPELERKKYLTRSTRNISVKKGTDKRRATSSTEGERRSKRGCEESSREVNVRTESSVAVLRGANLWKA